MRLDLTLIVDGEERRARMARELGRIMQSFEGMDARILGEREAPGQIVFVDAGKPGLERLLNDLDHRGRAIFLVVEDDAHVPEALEQGIADDVLVYPFRTLEVLSRLRLYQRLLLWDEVERIGASVGELVDRFREDLRLAERLQKAHLPNRIQQIKGLQVATRYLAGTKSGGDHFDLIDPGPGSGISMLLTDSSSYGLSSALISTLMRVALKLAGDRPGAVASMVRKIKDEVGLALGEKDDLSIFLAVLSRKDWKLRYLALGSVAAFRLPKSGDPVALDVAGPALKNGGRAPDVNNESELSLGAGDRLVLMTDGFVDCAGGPAAVAPLIRSLRDREPTDLLNELAFRVKAGLPADALPPQDCTGLVLEVDPQVLRLV
jgi:hypothetical protein